MQEHHGCGRQWGQLTSEPSTGNALLNVLKKEDLREKRDGSTREQGEGDSSVLVGDEELLQDSSGL